VANKGLNLFEQMLKTTVNSKLIKSDSSGNSIEVEFRLKSPAKAEEILVINEQLGVKLPNSFEQFLKIHDGGEIYDYEELDGFRILGTKDIVKINRQIAELYEDEWLEDIVIFAECIGEGNYLGFKVQSDYDEYKILDCFHEEAPVNWEVITNNFDEFLEKLVINNGNKYWLE